MKYQSLPKNLSIKSKNQKQAEQPLWNTFLRPVDQYMPEHSFHCECQMCKQYQHKKFKQNLDEQTKIINNKIRNRVTTSNSIRQQAIQHNYQWILKRLMIPHHKIATTALNIYITETLFFKDGEAVQFYLSKQIQDPTFKKIPKQKLNNAFIQKVMSDRRRKYKDYIRIKTGRKKFQQKKKLLFGQKEVRKQIKDAVLIRYNDGYQQLLTQNQFLSISLRRKQDPIWKQILSIRNFINITNPQQQNSSYVVIKFDRKIINDQKMFERTKTLMKVYGQYITKDDNKYISQQDQSKFAKNLQNTNLKLYAEYLLYQIVSYIQYFYDEQINLIVAGIYFDQIGHAFLNQVYKLQVESLIKFQWTNQIYRKRMDQQQAKILTMKQIVHSPDNQERATGIIDVMHQAYEKMRDRLGLNMQDEDDKEEVANNNFFKTLHPGFNQNISDVLKDGNLTLSQFKKVYLGFKPKKKPIIKQFTSNMIRTIHLTSPKLNTTNPHQYIVSPSKNKTINNGQRKRDTIFLSPLKLDLHRKLYETLPVKQMN